MGGKGLHSYHNSVNGVLLEELVVSVTESVSTFDLLCSSFSTVSNALKINKKKTVPTCRKKNLCCKAFECSVWFGFNIGKGDTIMCVR